MPVGLGTGVELPKLTLEEISTTDTSSSSSWLGILRVLLTIVEVGLTLIPGVGTAAATAIALGGAAAQTGLDVASGQVNPVNIGINFGSSLIPGVSAGIKGLRTTTISGSELLGGSEQISTGFADTLQGLGRQTGAKVNVDMTKIADLPKTGLEGFINQSLSPTQIAEKAFNQRNIGNITGSRFAINRFGKALSKEFERAGNLNIADEIRAGGGETVQYMRNFLNKQQETIRQTISGTGSVAAVEGVEGSEEDLRKILVRSGFTEAQLIELEALLAGVESQAARQSITLDFLRDIGGMDRARKFAENYYGLRKAAAKVRAEQRLPVGEPTWGEGQWKRFVNALKHPSSAEFNDVVVQNVQAIFDANDLGRAGWERLYQKLKVQINDAFKPLYKAFGKAEKLEEAFTKAGGILLAKSNDPILGYKIIEEIGQHFLIQITFRNGYSVDGMGTAAKHATWKGRRTKNFGGKAPVYVKANALNIERLSQDGMNYYLHKWAYSRGGAAVGVGAFGLAGLSPVAEAILPFINTGLLRNMLSLTSNIVENVSATVTGEGGFAKGWEDRFVKAFNNTWKNRAGRLFSNAVVGNAAGIFFGRKVGEMIGKETQRLASAATSTINKMNNMANPGSFGSYFFKTLRDKELQGVVSKEKRLSGTTRVTQTLGAQRKLGFIRRIPGAALPGQGPLNSLKIKV